LVGGKLVDWGISKAADVLFDQTSAKVQEHIRSHLHDPHWREVLLLLIAQQKRGNPAKCLTEILNFPDPYEPWLHRNLFFAAACLAEDIPVTDETLVAKILDDLVALEMSDAPSVSGQIKQHVFKTLCNLSETQFEPPALQRLLDAPAEMIDKVRLQEYRATLGQKLESIFTLLDLAKNESTYIHSSAAEVLKKWTKTMM
jgi:hypothetical protein